MRGRLISGLLVVIGLALVVWGVGSTFGLLPSPFNNSQTETPPAGDGSGEGFVPYNVPVSLDNSHTVQAPPALMAESANSISAGTAALTPQDQLNPTSTAPARQAGQGIDFPPEIPQRIVISAIKLDAPIVSAKMVKTWLAAQQYDQWLAPNEFAAGWYPTSSKLGDVSNTVLIGHHNVYGQVFRHLIDLSVGDTIEIYGSAHIFRFTIVNKMILPERYAPPEQRLENARWILPSDDQRLTLVTCWPFTSNTHRLILVASPLNWSTIPVQAPGKNGVQ